MDPSKAESNGSGLFPVAAPFRMISKRSFDPGTRVGGATAKGRGIEITTREGGALSNESEGWSMVVCTALEREAQGTTCGIP